MQPQLKNHVIIMCLFRYCSYSTETYNARVCMCTYIYVHVHIMYIKDLMYEDYCKMLFRHGQNFRAFNQRYLAKFRSCRKYLLSKLKMEGNR